jgi:alpha-1,3-rhamnosyl/mannosyltransferase
LEPRKITTSHGKVKIGDNNPGFLRRLDLKHIRRGLDRADLLICISQATADEARKLWPKKSIAVVPHGIDVGGYDPISYPLQKPEGLDHAKTNLLCVGSEEPRKRIDFLVEVLGALPSDVKGQVILHKVGAESNNKSKQSLSKRAEFLGVNLRWVGRLSDIDLCGYYQHCDALLFPSVAEGFGLPPLEAMASGSPVLVSDMPAHNEVAPKEWLLPHDDIDAWVDAIVEICTNQGRRQPSEIAMKRAREFSIEAWSKALCAAWNQLFNH